MAQVDSSVDSTKIKIGQEIKFKIEVEADTTDLVVFPEGQTFSPLEMIESYKIDTTKKDAKYRLIKQYGLTQFDSGSYTIPRQKITIGTKAFYTDSLRVDVNNIEVDTTKQGLYDIKPFIEVEKHTKSPWLTILYVILAIALVAFLLYWFIWRKKPLTEEDKIALLPPYDRAKLALKKLDESTYLENSELKDYYSELTFIIRKYLDEKVYDRALESTTDELISRLYLLNDANQIELSREDIVNLETILKRADLVKFAKSAPDVELAKFDRNTIDIEIDHVKEALPEPTEEEKLLNQQYKEEQERKKKRKKIILTVAISVFLLIATFVGFGLKYGFTYVKDTLIGHESKELLEGNWVYSEYGIPPVMISTPKVLKRVEIELSDEFKQVNKTQMADSINASRFEFKSEKSGIHIELNQQFAPLNLNFEDFDPVENSLSRLDSLGFKDIIVKTEKFITPNGAEGIKTFGSATRMESGEEININYVLMFFKSDIPKGLVYGYGGQVIQNIRIVVNKDDDYTEKIVKKIIDSIELTKAEQE